MAGLDDLLAQIPIQDIATKLGADQGEVNSAIQTLVPVLVSGLQHNAQDADAASAIVSAVSSHAASGLLDAGVSVDQVDQADGLKAVANIFGGNSAGEVASALAGGNAGSGDLMQKLLPILAPIVLAYVGKQFSGQKESAQQSSGGLGDVLGSILGGASGGSNNALGSILGSVLGDKGGALGGILGGLLGGKK